MLDIIRTTTKETLFYKLPTLAADLCIQICTLQWLMYHSGMVRPENLVIYERGGTLFLLTVSCFIAAWLSGIPINERNRPAVSICSNAILSAVTTWALFNGLMALLYELTLQGRLLTVQLAVTALLTLAAHLCARSAISRIRSRGTNNYTVLMVGTDSNMEAIYRYLTHSFNEKGYNILGFFTDTPQRVPEGASSLGGIQDVDAYIQENHAVIKEIMCALDPAVETDRVNALVQLCDSYMIRFKYVPTFTGYPRRTLHISQMGSTNVIMLHDEPLNTPLAKIIKRSADIVISLLFLCTFFPLVWLFCAVGIKLSSPGPILFRQRRTGYEGKEFWCLKFRSMHRSIDADTRQAVLGDARVFPFGAFLRRTSLDELPQFINVLRGDMSIIGPRPHMLHHTDLYSDLISSYMIRHLAKPGITGWAQVNGCRGETKDLSEMKERVEKDIWYIEHWSVELDVSIFFITLWQLIRHNDRKAY